MKVVSSEEMIRVEKLSVAQGASEEAFMENAGQHVAERVRHLLAKYHLQPHIALLLGRGNNAGDALVAGRLLSLGNCKVFALALHPKEECSELTKLQWDRFIAKGAMINLVSEKIDFLDAEILVDGIFGTGFKGTLEGTTRQLIQKANQSKKIILSIDIPSGINGNTGEMAESVIFAHETLFLGLPKKGCFLGEAWNNTGQICVRNFGLDSQFIEQAHEEYELLEKESVAKLLPKIHRTRHKYQAGYVIGIGGSSGMTGAPILASLAALRSGCGIVRLFHPEGIESEFLSAPLELIRMNGYEKLDEEMQRATACFIGPGIGTTDKSLELLKTVLPKIHKPCVIDAEALTLIAKNGLALPPQSVLTPHYGEMKRLLGYNEEPSFLNFIDKCRSYAENKNVTLILKGSPSWIFHSKGIPLISSFGDPGMATAGMGDVLTGIIAALLAQGLLPKEAAKLGVALHGLSGEKAASELTSYSLMATDVINFLSKIFDFFTKI